MRPTAGVTSTLCPSLSTLTSNSSWPATRPQSKVRRQFAPGWSQTPSSPSRSNCWIFACRNKVLVRARTKIRGASSGIEADFLFWAVWTFDEAGVPIRVEIYLDREEAEALEAARLRE
jgi:hypothetical protein